MRIQRKDGFDLDVHCVEHCVDGLTLPTRSDGHHWIVVFWEQPSQRIRWSAYWSRKSSMWLATAVVVRHADSRFVDLGAGHAFGIFVAQLFRMRRSVEWWGNDCSSNARKRHLTFALQYRCFGIRWLRRNGAMCLE